MTQDFIPEPFRFMRKMGLEPTRCNHHKILSLARLPVPTLPHYATDLRGFFSTAQYFFGLGVQDYVFSIGLARLTLLIITLEVKNVNRFLIVFCVCFSAKTKDTRTFKRVSRQQAWEVFME